MEVFATAVRRAVKHTTRQMCPRIASHAWQHMATRGVRLHHRIAAAQPSEVYGISGHDTAGLCTVERGLM